MITLSNLRKILDSIEQSTGNLKITFRIDQDGVEYNGCVSIAEHFKSVKIDQSIEINPDNPEPQTAPDAVVIITLE